MAGKRYYWIKLQEDFFRSKRIKKLRKMAGGDTYTIIYLKMQLLAMKTDGVLTYTGLENEIADELALDLDESPEDVRVTLLYLLSCGLAETSDNVSFFFPWVVANTGSETASAQRSRECRARKVLHCNTDATPLQHNATLLQQKCNVEKEIEKEIEIEKDISTPPSSNTRTREEENLGKVMSFIMDRLNPAPSPLLVADVKHFLETLDPDVIIHAVSIAIDEKKTSWSYIKAILQRYARDGKTTMLDVTDDEAQRQQKKEGEKQDGKHQGDSESDAEANARWGLVYSA